ncbi:MAG: phospho-N-acetylmuramoyl-pentapeptide-transferase [Deltaproteobacteria bacterium]|nr:MAG: phospho-N-acetylmuramoyl-pentapeptide-transferase [Deltaproteobacteria bacterium]
MIYHLLYPLKGLIPYFNVFRYITFRTIYASITGLLIAFLFGKPLIRYLKMRQVGQPIREDGPETHFSKEGTPTMGGVLIILGTVIPTLLWARLDNPFVWIVLFATISFGLIGFVDDYRKVIRNHSEGLRPRVKFSLQILCALVVGVLIFFWAGKDSRIMVPFFKKVTPDIGLLYLPFAVLIIVGASNAVNLTDGLDGLAIGPSIICLGTYMLFAYVAGHVKIARYLQIIYVPGAGELAVFCGAMAGAGMGFLWYNAYPAEIFMGDTGSLAIGAAVATVAVIVKQEILLAIVGGIFVVEALSVIIQVTSYKTTRKRVFRMAPIHHHFEKAQVPEAKIVVRFWLIAVILALIGISTLKLR